MANKEDFKKFAASHPQLMKHVENGSMTWQKFYEMYDIYGDNEDNWSQYLNDDRQAGINPGNLNFKDLPNLIKNIDMNSIQKHIGTAQKALGFVQDLTTKNGGAASKIANVAKGPSTPRPINKFFED